jgi:uncharacterized SAM-binding protein YcdF (DUF218 family)
MLPATFVAKKFISILLLPPLAPLLVSAIGLLLIRRFRRTGLLLAWLGLACALLSSLPASVAWLAGTLEDYPVISAGDLGRAQAIVILAGGRRSNAPEFGGETVSALTLERIRYGARLARRTGLPVLISGGAPAGGVPEAELMRRALIEDFGITPRWVETRSLDTRENALYSTTILRRAGIGRIALVTHGLHMRRSINEFARTGLTVYPAPMGRATGKEHSNRDEVLSSLPSMSSAYSGWYALHEWLGLLQQKFAGRG